MASCLTTIRSYSRPPWAIYITQIRNTDGAPPHSSLWSSYCILDIQQPVHMYSRLQHLTINFRQKKKPIAGLMIVAFP